LFIAVVKKRIREKEYIKKIMLKPKNQNMNGGYLYKFGLQAFKFHLKAKKNKGNHKIGVNEC
jgi:hypothetical protein